MFSIKNEEGDLYLEDFYKFIVFVSTYIMSSI